MLNFINKIVNQWFASDFRKVLLIGLVSRVLVFLVAIAAGYFIGTHEASEYPWDMSLPLVNHFCRWDTGHYAQIAIGGYPPGSNPIAIYWAWFPLYPILMGAIGSLFFEALPQFESVLLAGFLISNILFFVCLILFYKLSKRILADNRLALLSTVFFAFWPGSLFFSAVYSESLFMALALGAFVFLEEGKAVRSTLSGFLAAWTKSSGFLVAIPFLYNAFKKRSDNSIGQVVLVLAPYLLFNLVGIEYTGVFPVRDIAFRQYWGNQKFFLLQLPDTELGYALLFFIEFCLVLFPFIYLFSSKKLLVSVFSLGLKGDREDAKYFGFSLVLLVVLLFFSIIANVHRYALPMLPLYWVFAKLWNKKPKLGTISLALMISLLIIGTILFTTWRWYW